MSVRYVLTAVLPRYTMRRPDRAAPAAVAPRREADAAERLAAELIARASDAGRDDARVMGHD